MHEFRNTRKNKIYMKKDIRGVSIMACYPGSFNLISCKFVTTFITMQSMIAGILINSDSIISNYLVAIK